ncbi:reticulon-like protein [Citrus sinensis]|uniref:reticulon-like protein B14 isoform X2 n=1 Tax=Citrus sinensis TaxID=2711 RepID=UPI0003D7234A|nr:reticulon-like protein B14 isoform X2 [Citrus sinensis]XP_024047560.1 reticulon-like protein B14 isoform X1 [Citrus x clementina]KAH9746693.1 reticulon-like protein [Citrus sinensis]
MSGCLFGLQRPLHDILGGGTVADMLLWKNRNLSAAILVVVTVIWLLFEILEYNFITLLCYFLCFIMITLFIWSKAAGLIPMSPPTVDEIRLSDRTCTSLFANVNCLLTKFYDISCGENLKLYILTLVSLWILSIVGEYVSSLSLLYFGFLCLEALPALYLRFQGEVDYLAFKSTQDMWRLFNDFNSKVLDKIPRASAKEKKYL